MLSLSLVSWGKGQKKKVLFIGNSYTYVNDLPKMVADLAASTGDTLIYDSYAPGGYTFEQHSTDPTTLAKIDLGTWDYVVLQEQSQRPAFPIAQVEADVFPYAKILNDRIMSKNPCGETMFYMTWGRKNGDASNCPFYTPLCTFDGMNSELRARYQIMSDRNDALLSPVGAVWSAVRKAAPALELYSPDESHPSTAGTYLAACSFYTAIFQNNPTTVPFTAGLSSTDADMIRSKAKLVVYDSMTTWKIGKNDPTAAFAFSVTTATKKVTFTNSSLKATSYLWDFGDGTKDVTAAPTHTYPATGSGVYTVTLVARNCNRTDTMRKTVNVNSTSLATAGQEGKTIIAYPNPFRNELNLDLSRVTGKVSIMISNSLGQRIYQTNAEGGASIRIETPDFAPGLYFVNIHGDEFYPVVLKVMR